jgi:hypothetical protein
MWPGNVADVSTLIPVIDRLRRRFAIGRICVVADRGMLSTETVAALEERKLLYGSPRARRGGTSRRVVVDEGRQQRIELGAVLPRQHGMAGEDAVLRRVQLAPAGISRFERTVGSRHDNVLR